MHTYVPWCVEVREQLRAVCCLLSPCGSWSLTPSDQDWGQVPLFLRSVMLVLSCECQGELETRERLISLAPPLDYVLLVSIVDLDALICL